MCWEYVDIIASNIPQMKITAVSQWIATFNMQRKSEKCWCLLRNLSSGLFNLKKNSRNVPGLFQNFSKISGLSSIFQDFFQIPGLSRTFQDWWDIQLRIASKNFSTKPLSRAVSHDLNLLTPKQKISMVNLHSFLITSNSVHSKMLIMSLKILTSYIEIRKLTILQHTTLVLCIPQKYIKNVFKTSYTKLLFYGWQSTTQTENRHLNGNWPSSILSRSFFIQVWKRILVWTYFKWLSKKHVVFTQLNLLLMILVP